MPANTSQIYVFPSIGSARVTSANTASDGSGVLFNIYTAGVNGGRVDKVSVENSQVTPAASSAMMLRLFLSDNTGANFKLVSETPLSGATRSNTVMGAATSFNFSGGLEMVAGQILACAQSVYASAADQTDWVAQQVGDY